METSRLSLRKKQMEFKTLGELLINLEEFIEYASN